VDSREVEVSMSRKEGIGSTVMGEGAVGLLTVLRRRVVEMAGWLEALSRLGVLWEEEGPRVLVRGLLAASFQLPYTRPVETQAHSVKIKQGVAAAPRFRRERYKSRKHVRLWDDYGHANTATKNILQERSWSF
jgi:hypothetical protein